MALTPLATTADLDARNIVVPVAMDADTLIAAASSAVRDAAGCPILEMTATVTLPVDDYCTLDLPGGPVRSVASVKLNGVEIVGWSKFGNSVRFPDDVWTRVLPVEVDVTYTFGLAEVPADIIELVCAVVAMKAAANGDYAGHYRLAQSKLGEASETYIHHKDDQPEPGAIPDATRARLRARFGTSAAVIRMH